MAAPRHKITLVRFIDDDETEQLDITGDVISLQTDKSLSLSPGQFSIRYTPTARILNFLDGGFFDANNIVSIQMHSGEQRDDFVVVMFGLIVRSSHAIRVSGERVVDYVEVRGEDMSRWLFNNAVNFWAYAGIGKDALDGVAQLSKRLEIWQWLFPSANKPDLTSAEILQGILEDFIGKLMPRIDDVFEWHPIPTKTRQGEFTEDKDSVIAFGERYVPEKTLAGYSGSVANLLKDYALDYLTQLWCDTPDEGGAYRVYYRRQPFDQEDWQAFSETPDDEARKLHVIPDDEIVGFDLGKSDDEFYNLISVAPWVYGADTSITRFVLDAVRLDADSIKNRGLRQLMLTQRYLDYSGSDIPVPNPVSSFDEACKNNSFKVDKAEPGAATQLKSVADECTKQEPKNRVYKVARAWVETLWRWYAPLDQFQNGRLIFKGRPNVKAGQMIELACDTRKYFQEPFQFLVAAVSQDYDWEGSSFLTTARLIRGQPKDPNKFIRPSNDGKTDIQSYRQECDSGECKLDSTLDLPADK